MSFYHVHKNNPRLYASKRGTGTSSARKGSGGGSNTMKGCSGLRHCDDDYNDYQDGDYYDDDDDYFYDDYYEENGDEYEYKQPPRAPLTVNLLSTIQQQSSSKQSTIKKSKTKQKVVVKEATKKIDENDQLLALMDAEPRFRLVRSNSFQHDPDEEEQRRSRSSTPRRRSFVGTIASTVTDEDADFVHVSEHHTVQSTSVAAAIRCMQSLIPTRPSVFLSSDASITVFSNKCRVAVLVTYKATNTTTLRVIPLVGGCSNSIAQQMQQRMTLALMSGGNGKHHGTRRNDYTSYWRMSIILKERYDDWVRLLEELMHSSTPSSSHPYKILSQGCAKVRMTLGQCCGQYELLKDFDGTSVNSSSAVDAMDRSTVVAISSDDNQRRCLVCFDDLSNQSHHRLLPCGHMTCSNCYKSYFKSAANSGQGNIQCAAYKCTVTLDFYDAAHLFFDDCDDDDDDNTATFQRLVRFALERSTPPRARFCPSPNCGRILKPAITGSTTAHEVGFNLLLCDCGTSLCADCCNNDESVPTAHPGVSCMDFTKIRNAINSGKMNDELENVKWVLKNSRPCPQCQYPIQRDGGCNHVRCLKCNNYFCFQCGGEGQKCMAFYCEKKESVWQQSGDTNESATHYHGHLYKGLENIVDQQRAYRITSAKIPALLTKLKHGNNGAPVTKGVDELLIEIQCHQVVLWIQAATIARMTKTGYSSKKDTSRKHLLQLELIIHVLSLRNLMQQTHIKASNEALLAAVLGLPASRGKKRVSVCKQKAKERRGSINRNLSTFDKLFADQELEGLCKMSADRFAIKAREAIYEGIKSLRPTEEVSKARRRHKNSDSTILLDQVYPLNTREKRLKASWQNSAGRFRMKPDTLDDDDANGDWSDDGIRSNKRALRHSWKKSKARVNSQRILALDARDV